MTRLYLIRHAEAEGNLYRIAQGQFESALTDRGARQVAALERRFRDIRIDAVYTSDLYRACATAAAVYLPKNLPVRRRRDLREIHVGAWEQRTWGDIARESPEQMENFSFHPEKWRVEGSETPQAVRERMLQALSQIARENDGKTVAVFSHGYAIRLVLAALRGLRLEDLAQSPVGDNTAVSLLESDGDTLRIVFQDDNSHLQTPEFLAGETSRRHRFNALEPGLYFRPLIPLEQEALLKESGFSGEGGEVLAAYSQERAMGLIAFGDREDGAGRIRWAYIQEPFRRRGYGVQLIGQAVQHFRPLGCGKLRVQAPRDDAGGAFFRACGFRPADGGALEKPIGFDPRFLAPQAES